jgi:hypothetical protein
VSLQLALTLLGENEHHIGPLEMVASSVRLQNEISQLEMEQRTQLEVSPSKGTVTKRVEEGSLSPLSSMDP